MCLVNKFKYFFLIIILLFLNSVLKTIEIEQKYSKIPVAPSLEIALNKLNKEKKEKELIKKEEKFLENLSKKINANSEKTQALSVEINKINLSAVILLDAEYPDKNGAIKSSCINAINQKYNFILLTKDLLNKNIFDYIKKEPIIYDIYYLKNSGFFALILKSKEEEIKKYIKIENFEKIELEKFLDISSINSTGSLTVENFKNIFYTTEELKEKLDLKDLSWDFYINGHGSGVRKRIAGINITLMKNILNFFNYIGTNSVTISSCLAGGENKNLLIDDSILNFLLVMESVTEEITFHQNFDFGKYFNYMAKKEFSRAFHFLYDSSEFRYGQTSSIPQILLPGGEVYQITDFDKNIEILSNVKLGQYRIKKEPFEIKNKSAILVYPKNIDIDLEIENNDWRIFTRFIPVVQSTLYSTEPIELMQYFKSIKVKSVGLLDFLIAAFGHNYSEPGSFKIYLIEDLLGDNDFYKYFQNLGEDRFNLKNNKDLDENIGLDIDKDLKIKKVIIKSTLLSLLSELKILTEIYFFIDDNAYFIRSIHSNKDLRSDMYFYENKFQLGLLDKLDYEQKFNTLKQQLLETKSRKNIYLNYGLKRDLENKIKLISTGQDIDVEKFIEIARAAISNESLYIRDLAINLWAKLLEKNLGINGAIEIASELINSENQEIRISALYLIHKLLKKNELIEDKILAKKIYYTAIKLISNFIKNENKNKVIKAFSICEKIFVDIEKNQDLFLKVFKNFIDLIISLAKDNDFYFKIQALVLLENLLGKVNKEMDKNLLGELINGVFFILIELNKSEDFYINFKAMDLFLILLNKIIECKNLLEETFLDSIYQNYLLVAKNGIKNEDRNIKKMAIDLLKCLVINSKYLPEIKKICEENKEDMDFKTLSRLVEEKLNLEMRVVVAVSAS